MSRRGLFVVLLLSGCVIENDFMRDWDRNVGRDTDPAGDQSSCVCAEGFDYRSDDEVCVRTVVEDAILEGASFNVCSAQPYMTYGMYGARFPDGSSEQNAFWGQDNGFEDGRLNEVGVWTCDQLDEGWGMPEMLPVGSWIGFSVCVDIEEAGDFMVGLAADNRMRFTVDGTLEFERNDDSMHNFNYWWVQTISLTAGRHRVDFEGYNDGSIAALGAEISGPFPEGYLNENLKEKSVDYEAHSVWSTADIVGKTFTSGSNIGWSCPDGTTLDLCAAEPVCTWQEVVEC